MNSLTKIFLLCLLLLLISSCNSSIGLGASYNKGNLFFDSGQAKKQGVGFFAEYKWQHMFDRNGIGVDYNLSYKGYLSGNKEGADGIMQSIQLKYYYTLLEPEYNPIRLDISGGLGFGKTIGHFALFSKGGIGTPFLANASVDIYFLETQLIYISPKLGYIKNLHDPTLNLSVELSTGIYFGGR